MMRTMILIWIPMALLASLAIPASCGPSFGLNYNTNQGSYGQGSSYQAYGGGYGLGQPGYGPGIGYGGGYGPGVGYGGGFGPGIGYGGYGGYGGLPGSFGSSQSSGYQAASGGYSSTNFGLGIGRRR